MRTLVFSLLLALALGGCWSHVEDHCPQCAVVDHTRSAVPPTLPGTRTEVVLVHGAFGFGDEWRPVIESVRKNPGFDLVAWKWPGPFRNPPGDAIALRTEIQTLLDGLPASVDEVVVLAHSAGGLITNLAMRGLRVPAGRHVTVALLDPPFSPHIANEDQYPPVPEGVSATVFFAQEPPATAGDAAPNGRAGTDLPRKYLGKIGHDPMVGKASLPILEGRREAEAVKP